MFFIRNINQIKKKKRKNSLSWMQLSIIINKLRYFYNRIIWVKNKNLNFKKCKRGSIKKKQIIQNKKIMILKYNSNNNNCQMELIEYLRNIRKMTIFRDITYHNIILVQKWTYLIKKDLALLSYLLNKNREINTIRMI